ncbi:MAG TPA: membrane dipeptidase [Gemmataceae bacterium]|jgi:membrane dipeptidase|nr:membrane dipeptidase [Gemmataceae bacterium]
MIIFDAHLDLAWNAIDFNRDLRLSVAEIRRSEDGMAGKSRGCNTVSFPELRSGKVVIFIATLLARLLRAGPNPAVQRYTSMQAAYGAACGQLAYYRAMEQEGWLRRIKDSATLESHIRAWEGEAPAEPFARTGSAGASPSRRSVIGPSNPENSKEPLGFILSMEGADPILHPDQVHEWYTAGLRIVGPAHYGVSPYVHGTDTEGGLFSPGPALLKVMEEVGMILDVTHLADQSFDEALDIFGGPVLASHHNCRALVPHQRQLTDEQIKRLISRGAVIGSAFDAWMLYPGWIRGQTTPEQSGVKIETVVHHIDRVCQIAGNARHAAIGSDLDGGFGREQSPLDLDTIADLQRLPDLLRSRGYDQEAIEGIMHANWIRFFREAWKK